MQLRNIAAGVALGALATMAAVSFAATDKKDVAAIEKAVSGDWRKPEAKERDGERHPAASLEFWGLKPKMTILEVQPGGGWWTEILAPYARANKGEFYATGADLADPTLSDNAKKGRADFEAKWADAAVYGKVNMINWGPKSAPLPANKFDFVMLTRGMHGWVRDGPGGNQPVENLRQRETGRCAGHRAASRQGGPGSDGVQWLSRRGLRHLDRGEGGLQARRQVRDQRQSQGHQGSSLRCVDAAACATVFARAASPWIRRSIAPSTTPSASRIA